MKEISLADRSIIDKMAGILNVKQELEDLRKGNLQTLEETRKLRQDIETLLTQKTTAFPWLADAVAQYFALVEMREADYLENKRHPARKAAEKIRNHAEEKRLLRKQAILSRNLCKYYESLFPWIEDYVDENIDELLVGALSNQSQKALEEDIDPVRLYLKREEWEKLSTTERNQRALDNYYRKLDKWGIGQAYERYIGYQYEKHGYRVEYHGRKGIADLGRDLICKKDNQVCIIQCKCWTAKLKEDGKHIRQIQEAHINQLFGTFVHYYLKHKSADKQLDIRPVMITSTTLTDTAKEFAKYLRVTCKENVPMDKSYPCIKCNISKVDGEKIYHLPFDQQYDNVVIEPETGEFYAATIAEAEAKGFRRAFRWRGNKTAAT